MEYRSWDIHLVLHQTLLADGGLCTLSSGIEFELVCPGNLSMKPLQQFVIRPWVIAPPSIRPLILDKSF